MKNFLIKFRRLMRIMVESTRYVNVKLSSLNWSQRERGHFSVILPFKSPASNLCTLSRRLLKQVFMADYWEAKFPSSWTMLHQKSSHKSRQKLPTAEQRYLLQESRSSKSLKFPTRIRLLVKRDSKWVVAWQAPEPDELSPTHSRCVDTVHRSMASHRERGEGTERQRSEKREIREIHMRRRARVDECS